MKLMNANKDPYIYVEFKIKKKSGRSWIITPDGSAPVFEEVKVDNTILKALAKAHLWQRELKRGKYSTIQDLARKKDIAPTYVRRIISMCYLSPKIQEIIINGRQPKHLKLQDIIIDVPISWEEQEKRWLK